MWFLPPYSPEIKFNVEKYFLHLVTKHFGNDSKFRTLFNRHNLKVSYCTTRNFKQFIQSKKNHVGFEAGCSCRDKDNCPLNGSCKTSSVVYEAKVEYEVDNKRLSKIYIGASQTEFKLRYNNHVCSFRNYHKRKDTSLSNFVWSLKEKNVDYNITWRILRKCRPFANGSAICDLCKSEKWLIWRSTLRDNCLNRRTELVKGCQHISRFLLHSFKPSDFM